MNKTETDGLIKRLRQQSAFASLGRKALSGTPMERLMNEAVRLTVDNLEVEYCDILELLPVNDTLLLKAGFGWRPGLIGGAVVDAGINSQIGYVLNLAEPVVFEDLPHETRFKARPLLVDHKVISGVNTVIANGNGTFGVLGAYSKSSRAFDEHDVDFLQMIADILADAISCRSAHESYRSFFENAVDGISLSTISGRFLVVNSAMAQMLGYQSPKELIDTVTDIGKQLFVYPEDRKKLIKKLDEEGVVRDYHVQFHRRDGSVIWVSMNLRAVRDWKGEIQHLEGVLEDVSKQKEAEESLLKSKERLAEAQRIASLGNWEWDIVKDRLSWSDEIYRIFGLNKESFKGTYNAFLKAVHTDDLEYVRKSLSDALEGKNQYDIDHRIVLPDGSERHVNTSGRVYRDKDGNPVRIFGTVQDITTHRIAEQKLKAFNDMLNSMSKALLEYIGEMDVNSVFNQLLESLLSLTGSEYGFIGEVIYGDDGDPYLKSHAISNIAWNEETREIYKKYAPNFEFRKYESLYGAVITSGEPVISNSPSNDPRSGGTPEGHPLIKSFMGLPFRKGDKLVGMVGVANRNGGYDDELVDYLQPFLITCSNIIQAFRNEWLRQDAEEKLVRSNQMLNDTLEGVVCALSSTVSMKDPYTAGHQQRVAWISTASAKEMGLPGEQIEGLRVAATIHDIGKISVPTEILSKPGEINESEYALIKTHSRAGYDILEGIEFPWPVADMLLQHHERIDGSGYPQGLAGDDIIIEARILAIADVVESMSSHRPYRPAYGIERALQEIEKYRGKLFDPEVVDACLRFFSEKKNWKLLEDAEE